jgi:CRISPR-associated protein Cst2
MEDRTYPVYSLAVSCRVSLQAHSRSNAGSNGSNRLRRRNQRLSDGRETDAGSGNIKKHEHAVRAAELFAEAGLPLCPACAVGDGRRAMALVGHPDYRELSTERIVRGCAVCDTHGFLVTAKRASKDSSETEGDRQRLSKASLIECSFSLALPDYFGESSQLFTRAGNTGGEGQMLITVPVRSGVYAECLRYKPAGVGVDTETWRAIVIDEAQRRLRHQCVLRAMRDSMLSPQGALTSTMLPHLTGMEGAIAIRRNAGLAPLYSGLQADFIEKLVALADEHCEIRVFRSVSEFATIMNELLEHSIPAMPRPRTLDLPREGVGA